jgi:hypothetical protein
VTPRPAWLPELESCDGAWEQTLPRLYQIFNRDFIVGHPRFRNKPVWWNRNIQSGSPYEEGFWHLITKNDQSSGERLPDFRRAERLPWCAPLITNADDPAILSWDSKHVCGKLRTYLWLEDQDFVLILEIQSVRLGNIYRLITAYFIEGDGTRKKLRLSYGNRVGR